MKTHQTRRPPHPAFETHYDGRMAPRSDQQRDFHDLLRDKQQPPQPQSTVIERPARSAEEPSGETSPRFRERRDERRDAGVWAVSDVAPWRQERAALNASEEAREPRRSELQPIFDRVVTEAAVAQDIHRRKVVLLDLAIPGRGRVRVRVRRASGGAEVRFGAETESLREELKRRRGELVERGRERGVSIASVEVV